MNAKIEQTKKEIETLNTAIDKHTDRLDTLKKTLVEKERLATDALRATKASKYDDAEYAVEKGIDIKTYVSKKTTGLITKEDVAYRLEVEARKAVDDETEKRRNLEEQVKAKEQDLRLYKLDPQMDQLFVMFRVTNYEDLVIKLNPFAQQIHSNQAPQ
jgi:hypothetical protein